MFLGSLNLCHRDIASRNVLVYNSFKCVISDFGLASQGELSDSSDPESSSPSDYIPTLWAAPESLQGAPSTEKSEVW